MRHSMRAGLCVMGLVSGAGGVRVTFGQSGQAVDQEYTKKIKEYLRDPRISTELVDHLPAKGHVVSFAIRPFWRWQTQGNYFLGFNSILNWNALDAGRPGGGDSH